MDVLYSDLVLQHKREPRNFGSLPEHTHAAEGINALCGDRLHMDVDYRDDNVHALRFNGESCALTIASASIMSGMVIGKNRRAIEKLASRFALYMEGDPAGEASLGDLRAFEPLRRHASRRKCALLPWATLRAALVGAVVATTERAGLHE
jgi:nitrogen fixation protein NifU and related proteins